MKICNCTTTATIDRVAPKIDIGKLKRRPLKYKNAQHKLIWLFERSYLRNNIALCRKRSTNTRSRQGPKRTESRRVELMELVMLLQWIQFLFVDLPKAFTDRVQDLQYGHISLHIIQRSWRSKAGSIVKSV